MAVKTQLFRSISKLTENATDPATYHGVIGYRCMLKRLRERRVPRHPKLSDRGIHYAVKPVKTRSLLRTAGTARRLRLYSTHRLSS